MKNQSDITQSLLSIALVIGAVLATTSGAQAQAHHGWNVDANGHDRYVYKPEPWKPVEPEPSTTESSSSSSSSQPYETEEDRQRARAAARAAERDAELERAYQQRKQDAIAKYASIGEFYNGLALVTLVVDSQNRYGFIAQSYLESIAPIYLSATNFESGKATVTDSNGDTFQIDENGKRQPRFAALFSAQRRRVRSAAKLSPTDAKIASTL